jgi:hypothetical protein
MKIVRIISFTLLFISNIVFFVYGWIKNIESDNQRRINQELQLNLEIQKEENLKLKGEIENLNRKEITAANNGEHAGPR